MADDRSREAWQPFTIGGVARFAVASRWRLLGVQCLFALAVAGTVVWFISRAWMPVIDAAIDRMPQSGAIVDGRLAWPKRHAARRGAGRGAVHADRCPAERPDQRGGDGRSGHGVRVGSSAAWQQPRAGIACFAIPAGSRYSVQQKRIGTVVGRSFAHGFGRTWPAHRAWPVAFVGHVGVALHGAGENFLHQPRDMARRLAIGLGGAYAGGAGHVCRHALLRTEATGADRLGFCLGNPLGVALVLPFFSPIFAPKPPEPETKAKPEPKAKAKPVKQPIHSTTPKGTRNNQKQTIRSADLRLAKRDKNDPKSETQLRLAKRK